MVIQHNMGVLNASIVLKDNRKKLEKSTEKLSSGYRINRSADDAAGLAISEKMRKKIKGLERGMENVQDGISLCQVADGALDEVSDIIQRVRQLSIQAYNGTNSKSDRKAIQDEVDQCLKEVDRVFETTKFNEVYIFRNGNKVEGEVYHPESHMETRTAYTLKDIPEWLKINGESVDDPNDHPKIEKHPDYLNGQTQDLDGIMKQDFVYGVDSEGHNKYIKLYYGNDHGTTADGYRWAGDFYKNGRDSEAYDVLMDSNHEFYKYITSHLDPSTNTYTGWTPGFDDNVSAKLDFSGLAGVRDAKELYNKLADLVGTEIGFTCGTCEWMEAIRFGGEYIGVGGVKFHDINQYIAKTEINLSQKPFSWNSKDYNGYFDAVLDVMALDDTDPDKARLTTELADAIAQDLAQSTYNALSGAMTEHYDRAVFNDPADPYSIYIYDFRDTDAISPGTDISQDIWTYSEIEYDYEVEVDDGYYTHYDGWNSKQIWIQASDEVGDGIPIYSRYLSLERLGLSDYRLDSYASEVTWEDEEAYQKRLKDWMKQVPPPRTEKYTRKYTLRKQLTDPEYRVYYENGERKTELVKAATYETTEVEREALRYIYDEGEPMPTRKCDVNEVYKPSELSLLDDALTAVVDLRSYYGAIQNRLEHTYNNNYNADENTTAAESRIRDTDMAKEMVRNSMLNILQQAGISMLTQANQTSQNVNMLLGS